MNLDPYDRRIYEMADGGGPETTVTTVTKTTKLVPIGQPQMDQFEEMFSIYPQDHRHRFDNIYNQILMEQRQGPFPGHNSPNFQEMLNLQQEMRMINPQFDIHRAFYDRYFADPNFDHQYRFKTNYFKDYERLALENSKRGPPPVANYLPPGVGMNYRNQFENLYSRMILEENHNFLSDPNHPFHRELHQFNSMMRQRHPDYDVFRELHNRLKEDDTVNTTVITTITKKYEDYNKIKNPPRIVPIQGMSDSHISEFNRIYAMIKQNQSRPEYFKRGGEFHQYYLPFRQQMVREYPNVNWEEILHRELMNDHTVNFSKSFNVIETFRDLNNPYMENQSMSSYPTQQQPQIYYPPQLPNQYHNDYDNIYRNIVSYHDGPAPLPGVHPDYHNTVMNFQQQIQRHDPQFQAYPLFIERVNQDNNLDRRRRTTIVNHINSISQDNPFLFNSMAPVPYLPQNFAPQHRCIHDELYRRVIDGVDNHHIYTNIPTYRQEYENHNREFAAYYDNFDLHRSLIERLNHDDRIRPDQRPMYSHYINMLKPGYQPKYYQHLGDSPQHHKEMFDRVYGNIVGFHAQNPRHMSAETPYHRDLVELHNHMRSHDPNFMAPDKITNIVKDDFIPEDVKLRVINQMERYRNDPIFRGAPMEQRRSMTHQPNPNTPYIHNFDKNICKFPPNFDDNHRNIMYGLYPEIVQYHYNTPNHQGDPHYHNRFLDFHHQVNQRYPNFLTPDAIIEIVSLDPQVPPPVKERIINQMQNYKNQLARNSNRRSGRNSDRHPVSAPTPGFGNYREVFPQDFTHYNEFDHLYDNIVGFHVKNPGFQGQRPPYHNELISFQDTLRPQYPFVDVDRAILNRVHSDPRLNELQKKQITEYLLNHAQDHSYEVMCEIISEANFNMQDPLRNDHKEQYLSFINGKGNLSPQLLGELRNVERGIADTLARSPHYRHPATQREVPRRFIEITDAILTNSVNNLEYKNVDPELLRIMIATYGDHPDDVVVTNVKKNIKDIYGQQGFLPNYYTQDHIRVLIPHFYIQQPIVQTRVLPVVTETVTTTPKIIETVTTPIITETVTVQEPVITSVHVPKVGFTLHPDGTVSLEHYPKQDIIRMERFYRDFLTKHGKSTRHVLQEDFFKELSRCYIELYSKSTFYDITYIYPTYHVFLEMHRRIHRDMNGELKLFEGPEPTNRIVINSHTTPPIPVVTKNSIVGVTTQVSPIISKPATVPVSIPLPVITTGTNNICLKSLCNNCSAFCKECGEQVVHLRTGRTSRSTSPAPIPVISAPEVRRSGGSIPVIQSGRGRSSSPVPNTISVAGTSSNVFHTSFGPTPRRDVSPGRIVSQGKGELPPTDMGRIIEESNRQFELQRSNSIPRHLKQGVSTGNSTIPLPVITK